MATLSKVTLTYYKSSCAENPAVAQKGMADFFKQYPKTEWNQETIEQEQYIVLVAVKRVSEVGK